VHRLREDWLITKIIRRCIITKIILRCTVSKTSKIQTNNSLYAIYRTCSYP